MRALLTILALLAAACPLLGRGGSPHRASLVQDALAPLAALHDPSTRDHDLAPGWEVFLMRLGAYGPEWPYTTLYLSGDSLEDLNWFQRPTPRPQVRVQADGIALPAADDDLSEFSGSWDLEPSTTETWCKLLTHDGLAALALARDTALDIRAGNFEGLPAHVPLPETVRYHAAWFLIAHP